jgi:SAM-dependent methyltransferase
LDLGGVIKAHVGQRILLSLHPLSNTRHDETGWCSVCGAESKFVFNSWVIRPEQVADEGCPDVVLAYARRESLFCRLCCSSLRVRGIADVLLSLYGNGAKSIAEMVHQGDFRKSDVAEINPIGSMGSLHAFLAHLPHLAFSEYHSAERLGEIVGGARNEDICRLTYADQSFDLVLTSEILEHVPNFRAALRETRRVLRPGGRHVFTVPVVASRAISVARAEVGPEGQIVHQLPPMWHGRGRGLYRYLPVSRSHLTFTEFGCDLTEHLRDAGFEPEVLNGTDDKDQTGAGMVFSGRVPA